MVDPDVTSKRPSLKSPDAERAAADVIRRERDYYRQEYNEIGGRLLRLQNEQTETARAARRSSILAQLVLDAYRLTDNAVTPGEIGRMMCQTIAEGALSDRVVILRRLAGSNRFTILASVGATEAGAATTVDLPDPPAFFFSNTATPPTPIAAALADLLHAPFLLWSCDAKAGYALVIGNRSEGNIHRPFEGADRELIDGGLSVYLDIVRRKQAEVDLRQAKLEAEEAGRAQTRFLEKLSHELRTPMNAILGFSEMIKMAESFGLDAEACARYGEDINISGGYLLSLIEDILDFAAYGMEEPKLVEAAVDVLDLLNEAERGLRDDAKSKNITIEINIPSPTPPVNVDPIRLQQAIVNLVSNAVKYTPVGGKVTMTARFDPETRAITLEVADTGPGISAADANRVFEPFFQARQSDDDVQDGVGLGLAVARTLVNAHQGALVIESKPGEGATARISLPAARTMAAQTDRA